ncbi:MAG TPA: hypothetical protein VGG27_02230 [Magnetospirillaceae bacterium]|jgi:uncharacterized membrane protein YbhN (UPF0104 family)
MTETDVNTQSYLWGIITGNWVDILSLTLAFSYAIAKAYRGKRPLISKETALSIANGISLFPLILVVVSTFSNEALHAVLASNRVILSMSGIVALFSIVEDFPKKRGAVSPPQ